MAPTLRHGPEVTEAGVRYHWWSPECEQAEVVIWKVPESSIPDRVVPMVVCGDGWFEALDPEGRAGDCYRIRVDGEQLLPDVAARCQPRGVWGPSEVVDSQTYVWRMPHWKRPPLKDLIIYELHVGTWTPGGTFPEASLKLPHLCDLGVNAIQLMPLAAFPGARNWGYDPVFPFAPASCYGTPDDLKAFIDTAHELGLAVIGDVVYNHVCPEPNWFKKSSAFYFTAGRPSPWGESFNFDGKNSHGPRSFFLQNVAYWFDEYRVDGLRLDATHAINDSSAPHLLEAISELAHDREGFVIAEDERNEVKLIQSVADGGHGMDAVWADDFHHSIKARLTQERVGYFGSYQGATAEITDTLHHGWHFRGQVYPHRNKPRGSPCAAQPAVQFVHCISNHDQVGNRPLGERLHALTNLAAYRVASMLLCLTPYTPMIFMGQEWAAATPFFFFTNHGNEFGRGIRQGRLREFAANRNFWPQKSLDLMPDPEGEETFLRSKLNWDELANAGHRQVLELYRASLKIRRSHGFWQQAKRRDWMIEDQNGVILFSFGMFPGTRHLLIVNFDSLQEGRLRLGARDWKVVLSSNEARFGGTGAPRLDTSSGAFNFIEPEAILLRTG